MRSWSHLVFLFALACSAPQRGPVQVAPALELTDLQGQSHTIAQERGHPLLIHFGASW